MTITEAAEQVLFGNTLEEKLSIAALDLKDIGKKSPFKTPNTPQRPHELKLSESGVRAQFPGVNVLDQDKPRGELLHFLANHELLASELMALVLLKFPHAPASYRRGVYEAMREEQMHTLMYLRRMKECNVEFGQLPLNSYFWRLVSPMTSPMEFVTKLNLTFEQANLDFSKHYATLFREVGDSGTAAVLEKIYQDEIGHVGHGITWLREWKSPQQSDWDAYCSGLALPFSASKAKGMAPFNPEGRRKAGLNEEFITNLSVYSQSRGRNPIAHWFNPNAESHALAASLAESYTCSKVEKHIENDLELLMLAVCKQDDLLLLRNTPSVEHLTTLRKAKIPIPEILCIKDPSLSHRKLGGLRPWAWSPDAVETLHPFKTQIPSSVPEQWRTALPHHYLSKTLGIELTELLPLPSEALCTNDEGELLKQLHSTPSKKRLKLPYACSGRGHFVYSPEKTTSKNLERFVTRAFRTQKAVIVEPEYERVCDFSAHYDIELKDRKARLRGFTVMENSHAGQFEAAHVAQKWTHLLPEGIASFLFAKANFTTLYHQAIPELLPRLIQDYHGPVGIDALVYRDKAGNLQLRAVLEINTRFTMGRVALSLLRTQNASKGALRIIPKAIPAPDNAIQLNDPKTNSILSAYWSSQ